MKLSINKILLSLGVSFSVMGAHAQEADVVTAFTSEGQDSVHVAYNKLAKSEVWGAVNYMDVEQINKYNYSTYATDLLDCHVPGMSNGIWGQGGVLYVVDGVVRDVNNVLPSEIEQITVLKGAQAIALYGTKAAYGVILITTKNGVEQDLQITANANYTTYVPKSYPKYLSSGEYMYLYNRALINDGEDVKYSNKDIYNHVSGEDPERYPNIDMLSDEYVKNTYSRWDANVEVRGGGHFAKFYSNIGYYRVNDLLNFAEAEKNFTSRLNVRGNIDLSINKFISGYVHTSATFYDARNDNSGFWGETSTLRPNVVSPLISVDRIDQYATDTKNLVNNSLFLVNKDGKQYFLAGSELANTNAIGKMYAAGYNKYTSRQLEFDMGIKFDLSSAIKGLSLNAKVAGDYRNVYTNSISNEFKTFNPDGCWTNYSGPVTITSFSKEYGTDKKTGIQNMSGSSTRQLLTYCAYLDYNRTFAEKHNVSALVIGNAFQETVAAQYHKTCSATIGVQARYTFDNRYMADFTGAFVHSAKLPDGNRGALSPVATIGWNVSNESFLSDASWLDNLQIYASYGIINQDIDIEDYYMYQPNIEQAYGWSWYDGQAVQYTKYSGGDNLGLGYIKNEHINVGLNSSFLNGMLGFGVNAYKINVKDLLVNASVLYPSYFNSYWGSFVSNFNNDAYSRQGIDFSVNFKKQFGDVKVGLGVNALIQKSENTTVTSDRNVAEGNENLLQEGASRDAYRGLLCEGIFTSQDEIDELVNSEKGYKSSYAARDLRPGDLRYTDVNNDGIIDSKDQVVLGSWSDKFMLGLNLVVQYKNFTLFAACSGHFGGMGMKNNSYYWNFGERKYSVIARECSYIDEDGEFVLGKYPRLTSDTKEGNHNYVGSSFWQYSTNRFDLNKVQITYDFPKSMLGNGLVQSLAVYVNGNSLATIAKEKDYMLMNIGASPQTRSFNVGVKVGF